MLAYDPAAPLRAERPEPVARGRWCWPALLPGVAMVLDAGWPLRPDGELLWLDVAAILCLGWALVGSRRAPPTDWATSMDGNIAAGFVLALLHVIRADGDAEPMRWLHQIASSGACFYALAARLRRDPLAADAIWPSFAFAVLALSTFTLACATRGIEAIGHASRLVDVRWASQAGLAKTLLLATVLCAGRAMEPGARALWRVTALVGALSLVLASLPTGVGLRIGSLASLDEPFYFGTSIVAFMFLAGLARMAWTLARERPAEAHRWRAASLVFALVVVLLLFGGTTGGEGVRALTALAAAAAIAGSRTAQAAPGLRVVREPEATTARAA